MKVQGISVEMAQQSRGCGKAGFAKSGPQVERPPHRSGERPDFIQGAAYVRARTLVRSQQPPLAPHQACDIVHSLTGASRCPHSLSATTLTLRYTTVNRGFFQWNQLVNKAIDSCWV